MDRPVDLPPRSPDDVDVPPVDGGVLPADDAAPRSSADAGRVPARPLGDGVEPAGLALPTEEVGRALYAARAVSSGVDGSTGSGDADAFCQGLTGGERRDAEAPLNVAESVDTADLTRDSCAFLACVSSHSRSILLGCLVSGEKPIASEAASIPGAAPMRSRRRGVATEPGARSNNSSTASSSFQRHFPHSNGKNSLFRFWQGKQSHVNRRSPWIGAGQSESRKIEIPTQIHRRHPSQRQPQVVALDTHVTLEKHGRHDVLLRDARAHDRSPLVRQVSRGQVRRG